MRLSRVVQVIVVAAFMASSVGGERKEVPRFKCTRAVFPHIRCEARYVWPANPVWKVFYRDTDEIVDLEVGIVAFLTLPQGNYARFEMCLGGRDCLKAYGGWFGNKLRFRPYKD